MKFVEKYSILFLVLFVVLIFVKVEGCAILLGLYAVISVIETLTFLNYLIKEGEFTMGEILYFESDDEGDKTPIVKYVTKDGFKVENEPFYFISTDLSKFKSFKKDIGKKVSVLYSPKNPDKFVLSKKRTFNYTALLFLGVLGILFIYLGVLGVVGSPVF